MGFLADAYEEISPYIVTDCSTNALSGIVSRYEDYDLRQIVTPKGEYVLSKEYYEFHVDEEALDKLILDLFYRPKK